MLDRRDRSLSEIFGGALKNFAKRWACQLSSVRQRRSVLRKLPQTPAPMAVAEIQGLYGPFSFPEKLLQKIWLRGHFDRAAAVLTDGRRAAVLHPGKWNLLGGPDFRGARLRFGDGIEITGDVELHLHADDWAAHAHARDRAYDGVLLHVVLFPPTHDHVTRAADGRAIPVLVLLPLLHHDLEEFAADEAVESLAGRAGQNLPDELFALAPAELSRRLQAHAEMRWRQKVHFARLRIQRLGWEAACHHTALEILGYRFNRAPLLRLATRWPLAEWTGGAIGADAGFAAEADAWQRHGVRPANHPRTRLRQYAAWAKACPDWPARLLALAADFPEIKNLPDGGARAIRRAHKFSALRKEFAALTADAIGGARLDTLVGDGFLPLLAAHTEHGAAAQAIWFHWFPGDLPPRITRGLRELGVCGARDQPLALGPAQGLLGWWLVRESQI